MNKANITLALISIVAALSSSNTSVYGMFPRAGQLAIQSKPITTRPVSRPYIQTRQASNITPPERGLWEYIKAYIPFTESYNSRIEFNRHMADLAKENTEERYIRALQQQELKTEKEQVIDILTALPKVNKKAMNKAVNVDIDDAVLKPLILLDKNLQKTDQLKLARTAIEDLSEEHLNKVIQFHKDLDEQYEKDKSISAKNRQGLYWDYINDPNFRKAMRSPASELAHSDYVQPWFKSNITKATVKLLGLNPEMFKNQFLAAEKTFSQPDEDDDYKRFAYEDLIKKEFKAIQQETDPFRLALLVARGELTQEQAAARIEYANNLYKFESYLYPAFWVENTYVRAGLAPKGFMVQYRKNPKGYSEGFIIKIPNPKHLHLRHDDAYDTTQE